LGGRTLAYLLAAKLVAAAHFGFVAFLFFGAQLFASYRGLVWVHVACLTYGVLITVVDWSCPLTLLEQWLLDRGGAPVYSGEFLPHYVWARFGLTGSELPVAGGLILALLAANAVPYWSLFRPDPT
jgi:hypothetical protein